MTNSDLKTWALKYHDLGWCIIPLNQNKISRVKWKEFQYARPTTDRIKEWWDMWPDASIGCLTGKISGIMSVDLDDPERNFLDLRERGWDLDHDTAIINTGRDGGGFHYVFSCNDGLPSKVGALPNIDINSNGRLIVLPPSIHKTGRVYGWSGLRTYDQELPPYQRWLVDLTMQKSEGTERVEWDKLAEGLEKGERDDYLFRAACNLRGSRVTREVAEEAILVVARRCNPPFPEEEALAKVDQAWKYEEGRVEEQLKNVNGNGHIKIYTSKELADEPDEEVEWLCYGFVACGATTEIIGLPKAAGKTTFMFHMLRAILTGDKFITLDTDKTEAIYLSEQPKASCKNAMRRDAVLGLPGLHVIFSHDVADKSWAEICDFTLKKAMEKGARLVIIDTLAPFVKFGAEQENDSGASIKAMNELQKFLAEGIAVVIVRHSRKSGGDPYNAGRGSGAITGAVDIVVHIEPASGKNANNHRTITCVSRFDETPDKTVVAFNGYGYEDVDGNLSVKEKIKEALKIRVTIDPNDPETVKEISEMISEPISQTLRRALEDLVKEGVLVQSGEGNKGSPHMYYREL